MLKRNKITYYFASFSNVLRVSSSVNGLISNKNLFIFQEISRAPTVSSSLHRFFVRLVICQRFQPKARLSSLHLVAHSNVVKGLQIPKHNLIRASRLELLLGKRKDFSNFSTS